MRERADASPPTSFTHSTSTRDTCRALKRAGRVAPFGLRRPSQFHMRFPGPCETCVRWSRLSKRRARPTNARRGAAWFRRRSRGIVAVAGQPARTTGGDQMFRIPLVATAAVFAAGVAFAAEPIKVGISIAQSPPGSVVQGTQVKDGLEIVKDIVNKQGGVLGRPIELVYEDNQGIPEKGRAASEKLITNDKVVAITGGHQSSVCLAEIEVAHRYGVPYINTNCWSDDVRTKHYPEVFNPSNYNSRVAQAMAETIAALGVKSVVAF